MSEGLYAIKWPDAETAFRLLFSPARGLFFWFPFLLLAGFGYWQLMQKSTGLFWLTYAIPVLHLAVISVGSGTGRRGRPGDRGCCRRCSRSWRCPALTVSAGSRG